MQVLGQPGFTYWHAYANGQSGVHFGDGGHRMIGCDVGGAIAPGLVRKKRVCTRPKNPTASLYAT